MTIILGIDPGFRITGYGLIKLSLKGNHYLASGCIRVEGKETPHRLFQIYESLKDIVKKYQPHEVAVEQVFMHQNVNSALKLGQARGVAMVAVANSFISMCEYSPRQIKKAVVGYGGAKKEQVQKMVKILLNLSGLPQTDAADALAVALCHAHFRKNYDIISKI